MRVQLAKHPDYEVEDHNLIYEAQLAPWEAVLGTNLAVPTLEGRVNIKIPPGTQDVKQLRVPGPGFPPAAGAGGAAVVGVGVGRWSGAVEEGGGGAEGGVGGTGGLCATGKEVGGVRRPVAKPDAGQQVARASRRAIVASQLERHL